MTWILYTISYTWVYPPFVYKLVYIIAYIIVHRFVYKAGYRNRYTIVTMDIYSSGMDIISWHDSCYSKDRARNKMNKHAQI
jgi:hypothetical protein